MVNRSRHEISMSLLEVCREGKRLTKISNKLNTNAFFTKNLLMELEKKGFIHSFPIPTKDLKLVDVADSMRVYVTTKEGLELVSYWSLFICKYNLSVKPMRSLYIPIRANMGL